jgi:hypothetical protein
LRGGKLKVNSASEESYICSSKANSCEAVPLPHAAGEQIDASPVNGVEFWNS